MQNEIEGIDHSQFEALDASASPVGWNVAGDGEAIADGDAAEGRRSLKVTRAAAIGLTRVTQRVPAAALRAGRDAQSPLELRLTGLAQVARRRRSGAAPSPGRW